MDTTMIQLVIFDIDKFTPERAKKLWDHGIRSAIAHNDFSNAIVAAKNTDMIEGFPRIIFPIENSGESFPFPHPFHIKELIKKDIIDKSKVIVFCKDQNIETACVLAGIPIANIHNRFNWSLIL